MNVVQVQEGPQTETALYEGCRFLFSFNLHGILHT